MSKPKKKAHHPLLNPINPKPISNQREVYQPWHDTASEKIKPYDAMVDPHCIYTKSSKFKEGMRQRLQLLNERSQSSQLLSKSVCLSSDGSFGTGIHDIARPITAPEQEKNQKVKAAMTSTATGGLTISNDQQGEAEIEVLKAILNREGYLNRLEKAVKKIGRKFKPEISDIIDLIRAASLDVVESIVKWREAKADHDAIYEWNGLNYLLKMPSDLDYLSGYKAIRDWLGFSIKRNPFSVPFPLEHGVNIFSDAISEPKHVEDQRVYPDGFVIGNISAKTLRAKYKRVDPPGELRSPYLTELSPSMATSMRPSAGTPATSRTDDSLSSLTHKKQNVAVRSPYSTPAPADETQSFVFNHEMVKVRQAELVILKEESKYGLFRRAPDGRLMPAALVDAAEAIVQLKKDNHKPLSQKSATTEQYAPHAIPSGVGLEPPRDFPDEVIDREELDDLFHDVSVPGRIRGKEKVGGELAPIIPQGAPSQPRKPLPATPTSSLEYVRQRKKQTIGQRLAEITELRNKIRAERLAMQQRQELSKEDSQAHMLTRGGTSGTSGSLRGSVARSRKGRVKPVKDGTVTVGSSDTEKEPSLIYSPKKVEMPVISDAEIDADMSPSIKEECTQLTRDLNRISSDEGRLSELRDCQRSEENGLRAREIERKRRLLDKNPLKMKGAIIEDAANVYDFYATRMQAAIRGWLARVWVAWYRKVKGRAAVTIQAYARGFLARRKVGKMKRETVAITLIQSHYRGHLARVHRLRIEGAKDLDNAATKIQKVWRRVLGVRRSVNKMLLDKAAKAAYAAVDARSLFPLDVKELARRIQLALEEPETTTFPPDEVLQLIRIAVTIIETGKEYLGLTVLNHIQVRNLAFLSGEALTWEEAMMVTNRSNRFVRIVRAQAYAPCARPPRLVRVPSDTRTLYEVLRNHNPKWNISTFEMIGPGSKCCVQLFKWVTAIMEASQLQEKFLAFIGNKFADWLNPLFERQKVTRQLESDCIVLEKRISVLEEFKLHKNIDASLVALTTDLVTALTEALGKLKDDLRVSQEQEDAICSNQAGLESYNVLNMKQRMNNMEETVASLAKEFQMKLASAENGDVRIANELAELRVLLVKSRVELREITVSFQLLEAQSGTNRMIRIGRSPLPPEIRVQAYAVGESQAFMDNVDLKKQSVINRSGKSSFSLDQSQTRNLARLQVEEERNKVAYADLYRKALESLDEYHGQHCRLVLKKQQQVTDIPFLVSEEELEEDRKEDEMEAKAERLKRRQYVPNAVLFHEKPRPRPVLIAYSRDIPSYLKDKIVTGVAVAMPGLFVPVDVKENMGLDLKLLQDILDAKKSIIINVDHGLTKTTRNGFKKNFEMTMSALVPKPVVVFVLGDDKNIALPSGEVYFGVSNSDLSALRDREIKICMEQMSTIQRQILQPSVWRMIAKLSALIAPPPVAYITVLEALFIIQADHDNFRLPDYHIAAVSWKATQTLLKDPEILVQRLRAVPRGRASERVLLSLSEYIKHRTWPSSTSDARRRDPLLNLLTTYVETWTACEQATLDRGGVPDNALFKNSIKFLQTVVTVSDLFDSNDVLVADKRGGWQVPVAQIVRSCLQDMRVYKAVQRIDFTHDSKIPLKTEKMMYSVNVYRDGSNIYFDTYDSMSSQVYMTSVKVASLPDLLAPNTYAITHGLSTAPPQSSEEMYKRLLKLLRFEKVIKQKGGRRQLICRRDFAHLGRLTRKIDGHTVVLNSYEAALGEVYFDAYIPSFSCHVKLLVDDDTRLKMRSNFDTVIEKAIVDSDKAAELVPYFIDRLRVSPSLSLLGAKGRDPIGKMAVMNKFDHQGFTLNVRSKGGAGLKLRSRCVVFAGVPHILVIRASTRCKTMRVIAYQPQTQHSMQISISSIQRKLLLGSDDDDVCNWLNILKDKLRLVWRGEHKLELNTTLCQAVKRISGKRIVLKLHLESESSILVKIFDPKHCTTHRCSISKDDIIRILHHDPIVNDVKEQSSKVGLMLRKMITSTGRTYEKSNKEDLDIALFDVSLEMILRDKQNTFHLMKQLEKVLERSEHKPSDHRIGEHKPSDHRIGEHRPSENRIGEHQQSEHRIGGNKPSEHSVGEHKSDHKSADITYYSIVPVALKFEIEISDPNPAVLTTELRRKGRLNKVTSDGSAEGVTASRRQATVLNMEDELNALAERKEEEARLVAKQAQEAAAALEETLNSTVVHKLIHIATAAATSSILDDIDRMHGQYMHAQDGNSRPGTSNQTLKPPIFEESMSKADLNDGEMTDEQREILVRGDRVVFERGAKINFRDGAAVWHAHVKVKVMEGACWGGKEGVLRRFHFIVFEPGTSCYYSAIIKNTRHMREVLGPTAQDLAEPAKTIEMLLYICAERLQLVRNNISADGEPVEEGAPYYRLEFVRDRLYVVDKVTPVQAAGDEDGLANRAKLIDNERMRGRKILRLARRVNGILMHLQVFEIPKDPRDVGLSLRTDEDEKPLYEMEVDGAGEPLFDGTMKKVRIKLEKHDVPLIRIVGYEPKAQAKTSLLVDPRATAEVAGGLYSQYLDVSYRRELARLVCDALVISHPRGKPFELAVPWSGAPKDSDTLNASENLSRSTAEKVLKRPGRIFRSGVVISHLDLIVTVFTTTQGKVDTAAMRRGEVAMRAPPKNQLIMNFYSTAASEAFELVVSEKDQVSRIGRPVPEFPVGAARATAIRRLCRYCHASIEPDPENKDGKLLIVQLIPPKKDFLDDYKNVAALVPGEDIRPVGAPVVFMPLDTRGETLYKRGMPVPEVGRNGSYVSKGKEYVVSVYSKSATEGPERGLVVHLYDRIHIKTLAIHIGPSELVRLCDEANEHDLLHDMATARWILKDDRADVLEADFVTVTERGVLVERAKKFVDSLVDLVLRDLGIRLDALGQEFPCLRSSPFLPS